MQIPDQNQNKSANLFMPNTPASSNMSVLQLQTDDVVDEKFLQFSKGRDGYVRVFCGPGIVLSMQQPYKQFFIFWSKRDHPYKQINMRHAGRKEQRHGISILNPRQYQIR